MALIAALLALVLGGGAFAFGSWVNNSAYLAELDGKVAVYQGIPGSLFGREFSELAYTTTIEVDDLQPGAAKRLRNEGIRTDDMKAALALVESYAMDLGTTFDEVATEVTSEPPASRNPEAPEAPEAAEEPQAVEPPASQGGDAA